MIHLIDHSISLPANATAAQVEPNFTIALKSATKETISRPDGPSGGLGRQIGRPTKGQPRALKRMHSAAISLHANGLHFLHFGPVSSQKCASKVVPVGGNQAAM